MLSVIVPVYNVEKYLSRCISSILRQSYRDLEVILVDDGSTDLSSWMCDAWKRKDRRIRVVHQKNGGLSAARNTGIEASTGDYIAFVDSDDWIHENMYQILMDLMTSYEADIVGCSFIKVDESQDIISENQKELIISVYDREESLMNLYNQNYVESVVTWNKIYKRQVIGDIRFPHGKIHEDEYTTYKFFYNSGKYVHINRQFYYYLQRADSIMGKKYNMKRLDFIEAIEERLLFYQSREVWDFYFLEQIKYANSLLSSYYYVFHHCGSEKQALVQIRKKYRMSYKKVLVNPKISMKGKFKYSMCYLNPNWIWYFDKLKNRGTAVG